MINIFKKIYIHPLYYIFLIIIVLTANIRSYINFSILILVHEFGHIFTSLLFNWNIEKIVILPYGMITFFKHNLAKPIYQEALILIMGPLIQVLFNIYFKSPYSNIILMINLLPIYPLDGSKFLFLLFNKLTSYYMSYIYSYIISFIVIIYLLINNNNLLILLMIIYLLYHLINYYLNLFNTLLEFCYERFKFRFYSLKKLNIKGPNIKAMHRDKYHLFLIDKKIVKEYDLLAKMFDK